MCFAETALSDSGIFSTGNNIFWASLLIPWTQNGSGIVPKTSFSVKLSIGADDNSFSPISTFI